jgi:hypothetical protein
VSRTIYVPLKLFCGADVSAGTPFLSFTEYLPSTDRMAFSDPLTVERSQNAGKTTCANADYASAVAAVIQGTIWLSLGIGLKLPHSSESPGLLAGDG